MTIWPNRWQLTTSGELCEFITSGSRDWKSFYSDDGAMFIRTQDINQDRLDLSFVAHVALPPRVEGKRSLIQPGDLLITITGANVGKVALVPDGIPEAYVSQSVGLMRLTDKRLGPFIHYYLQCTNAGRKHVLNMVYGIGRPVLNLQNLRNIPIMLPPLAEQQRIVERIEELVSDLDAGVATLERVQAKLKRYRAAVLKAAVEGALTAEWRAKHLATEPASVLLTRILAERRRRWEEVQLQKFKAVGKTPPKDWKAKYQEPVAPDTTNLPSLPEGWNWASVQQVGETITGFTPSTGNSAFFGGEIPFFKPTDLDAGYNVRNCRETLTEAGAAEGRLLPELSILVTCIGATIGKVGLARCRCATNQQINALTVLEGFLSPFFVFWSFCSPFGQKQIIGNASATTLPILNKGRFQTLPVALPPLAEQEAIVEAVDDQLSVIEHLELDLEAKLESAQALRQSILRHAFTGQLVPQDPQDESAAELLKRIAAQREELARQADAVKKAKPKVSPKRAAKKTKAQDSHD